MARVRITCGEVSVEADFNQSGTAQALLAAMPLHGTISTWGQEIYFATTVDSPTAEDARDVLTVGEIAYWSPGRALCVFFGPTPASRADEPRAASDVNPVGQVSGDASLLATCHEGQPITVERIDG